MDSFTSFIELKFVLNCNKKATVGGSCYDLNISVICFKKKKL